MGRPVTLFTGQWADLPLEELAEKASSWGYDGLELACWGDHFEVDKALADDSYCDQKRELLDKYGLGVWSISTHLVGQVVCDLPDPRTDDWVPDELKGKGEEKSKWAQEEVMRTALAAKKLGVSVVNGFTGSPIWHLIYSFPAVPPEMIEAGFQSMADKWNPIMDEFGKLGIKFALEVHPTEIAFDIYSAERTLQALDNRPEFGFNFDPSHLQWQGVEPARFIKKFPDRIYHVHMKDAAVTLDGDTGILASYLPFGDGRRGWDFRSLGHGDVDFESIIRELNRIQYQGPLSVEWEDAGMDREYGAAEACEFVKTVDFAPSDIAFDAAFNEG